MVESGISLVPCVSICRNVLVMFMGPGASYTSNRHRSRIQRASSSRDKTCVDAQTRRWPGCCSRPIEEQLPRSGRPRRTSTRPCSSSFFVLCLSAQSITFFAYTPRTAPLHIFPLCEFSSPLTTFPGRLDISHVVAPQPRPGCVQVGAFEDELLPRISIKKGGATCSRRATIWRLSLCG